MREKVTMVVGDITEQRVDAIVNSAHSSFSSGGNVAGAILSAGGPGLVEECNNLEPCSEGEARITGGYDLPCKYVVHTLAPMHCGGTVEQITLLKRCHVNSLSLAYSRGCRSVAFPAIACGHHHFPGDVVARIAMIAVRFFLEDRPDFQEVRFVLSAEAFLEDVFVAARDQEFAEEAEEGSEV